MSVRHALPCDCRSRKGCGDKARTHLRAARAVGAGVVGGLVGMQLKRRDRARQHNQTRLDEASERV